MSKTISFDLHDTILVFRFGKRFRNVKVLRAILYFLSNFKFFIFIYTYFCQRNEAMIGLMRKSKEEGNKNIILTSTNQRCSGIIYSFLKKNNINYYDQVIFRKKFWQSQGDYKAEEMKKNNIVLHYDDSADVCEEVNQDKKGSCIIVKDHEE